MQNFVQAGDVVSVTAPAAVSSGDGVQVGSIFGVATRDAANGASIDIRRTGVVTLPADGTASISAGDRVFWDDTNGHVDKTATAQLCVGVALTDESGGSCQVILGGITPSGT